MLLITSLLLVLLPKKIVNACGFYVSPGEYRFWILQPDLTNTSDLTPFFFASTYLYKGDQFAGTQPHVADNIRQWYLEVKGRASARDIDSVLNNMPPAVFFEISRKKIVSNTFLNFLKKTENKELHQYLVVSKKVEEIAANPDPWNERNFPAAAIGKVIASAQILLNTTRSPFLKLRTAYQLVRLYAINGQPDLSKKMFDAFIAPAKTDNWIKTAALFQTAFADTSQADYILSKVFDRGNYNRVTCLVRFNSANLPKVLSQAKNTHERVVIEAMKVFNYPGRSLNYLQNIYAAEAGYKELPFLLLREINKVEDWLLTPKVTDFSPAVYNGNLYDWYYDYDAIVNYNNDKVYAKQLYHFVKRIINEKKNNSKLLPLFASHLAMLQGDYSTAKRLLEINDLRKLPENVQAQISINRFLLQLEGETITSKTQADLMAILHSQKIKSLYDADIMKDQLILYTGRKFIEKGERAKGLMLLSKTRRALGQLPIGSYKNLYQLTAEIALPTDYDEIIKTLKNKNKTRFEKFVSGEHFNTPFQYYNYYDNDDTTCWNVNKLLDGKASWHIRNNELSAAFKTLQSIPNSYWRNEPYTTFIGGDPFYLNIFSAHKISPEEKLNCNKREVIAKMLHLQQIAQKQPDRAAWCYYNLANAWYNLSWHGKDWLIVKQWWSQTEDDYSNDDVTRTKFNDNYYGCMNAKVYYLKALAATKDKKLASLCCYLAGQCDQNFKRYLFLIENKGKYNSHF